MACVLSISICMRHHTKNVSKIEIHSRRIMSCKNIAPLFPQSLRFWWCAQNVHTAMERETVRAQRTEWLGNSAFHAIGNIVYSYIHHMMAMMMMVMVEELYYSPCLSAALIIEIQRERKHFKFTLYSINIMLCRAYAHIREHSRRRQW